MSATEGLVLRAEGPEALAAAHALAKQCYGEKAEPLEWWRWYLFGLETVATRIVLAYRGERVVGMQPLMISRFRVGTGHLAGAILCGAMVHPACRKQGIFRRLVEESLEESWRLGAEFSLTLPNARSYPAFLRFGWRDLGERTLLAAPSFLAARRGGRGEGLRTERVERFGEDAGALCERLAERSAAISPERTDAWLRWRFDGNPLGDYLKMECRDPAGNLIGLAAGRSVSVGPLRIGLIVELASEAGDPTRVLTSGLARELRKRGAGVVAAVVARRELVDGLLSLGFWRAPRVLAPKRFFTVWHPGPDEARTRLVPPRISDWRLTLADWDGI